MSKNRMCQKRRERLGEKERAEKIKNQGNNRFKIVLPVCTAKYQSIEFNINAQKLSE